MHILDGSDIRTIDLVMNDDFFEKIRDDVIENSYYAIGEIDIRDRTEDYLRVKEIAPNLMFEVWYDTYHYDDVWDKVTVALEENFKHSKMLGQKIETGADIEKYKETMENVYYDVAMMELQSKMKFFGVKDLHLCEDYMRENDIEIWWKKYEHIEDTDTRVYQIYLGLLRYGDDELVELDQRIRKGHTLYCGKYGPIVEYDADGEDYKNWADVR